MINISSLFDQPQLKECIEKGILKKWMISSYTDFRNSLLDNSAPYPCYFAVEAEKRGHIRYIFAESAYDMEELFKIRDGVYEYIKTYKSIGKRTTLVIFFKPSEKELPAEEYKNQFWNVVNFLNENDPEPWPSDVPENPNDPKWEFCFGGEPIFLVCRAPFYMGRKSRYTMHGLEITMQPRGTLDDITADTKKGQQVRKVIRERLKNYDSVDLHPDIGNYGDPTNKEWRQYLLPETNDESVIRCPIRRKAKVKS